MEDTVKVCTRATAFGTLAACKGKHAVFVNGILADEGISCAVVPVQIGNGCGIVFFVNGDVALFRAPSVVLPVNYNLVIKTFVVGKVFVIFVRGGDFVLCRNSLSVLPFSAYTYII